jgi:putative tryptophan/tyrosine transport system substrate-binding protein
MRRREFVVGVTTATIFLPCVAEAQRPSKVWRIAVLDTAPRRLNSENINAFMRGLRELGYEEGRNLSLEYRTS